MTPKNILDLVRDTAPGASVDERPGLLIVRTTLTDHQIRRNWISLRAAPPEYLKAVNITHGNDDEPLSEDETPSAEDYFRITIETHKQDGQLRLFFSETLAKCESALVNVEHVLIASMDVNETFSTYRSRFQFWSTDPAPPFAPSEAFQDPRGFTSDFTGSGEVPSDIRPWLLRGPPEHPGQAYRTWGDLAARRLMATVSDRVSHMDGQNLYHFNGPPSCSIKASDFETSSLFPILQQAAAWIFVDGRDTDTRHLLLASEWARTYRTGHAAGIGDGAVESAKSAYAAYVKSGSKETLKALAELRKSTIDESQKASQRAQDLSNAIWKDIALAAVPFLLKIIPDASKSTTFVVTAYIAAATAGFLLFSFAIQIYINYRFFKQQAEGRSAWKREIGFVLRGKEIEELSEAPIQKSLKDYNTIRLIVGFFYLFLIASLLCYSWYNFQLSTSVDQTSVGELIARDRSAQRVGE